MVILAICSFAKAQDIIVKKDGTILNVYNLEEGPNSYFYTLELSSDAATQKVSKSDVFSVKINGTTSTQQAEAATGTRDIQNAIQQNTSKRNSLTVRTSSDAIRQDKDGLFVSASTPDGHELNFRILSQEEQTLSVTKGEYHETKYIIPEYVLIGDKTYTVTEIEKEAFYKQSTIKDVTFPTTLKKIGTGAFSYCPLESIILPEGLEELNGFWSAGKTWTWRGPGKANSIKEIYIPSSIKSIGLNCFLGCGKDTSWKGYCQAYFSNLPEFITEGNCLNYGIDEEAVRTFYTRKKK